MSKPQFIKIWHYGYETKLILRAGRFYVCQCCGNDFTDRAVW